MAKFLIAEWTNLVVVTYEVDKSLLQPYLPFKTELNDWNGKHLLSILGFMFRNPALLNFKLPFYKRFPEINLRFYARAKLENKWKNGVVFIREISPSFLVGQIAKFLYKEKFISLPMRYRNCTNSTENVDHYSWKWKQQWNHLELTSGTIPTPKHHSNIESFISDQYTAFTSLSNNRTLAFQASHRPWEIFPAFKYRQQIDGDVFGVKGLSEVFQHKPKSIFLMDGSYTEISSPKLLS